MYACVRGDERANGKRRESAKSYKVKLKSLKIMTYSLSVDRHKYDCKK